MATNSTPPCYSWGGIEADPIYTPCNTGAAYSMCCRSQKEGVIEPDSCLPNGLCAYWGMDISGLHNQSTWIESCSDPSWKDPACATAAKYTDPNGRTGCFRVCTKLHRQNRIVIELTLSKDPAGSSPLGYCPDSGTYCCNQFSPNITCCDLDFKGNIAVEFPAASMVAVTTSFSGTIYTTVLPTLLSSSSAVNAPSSAMNAGSSAAITAEATSGAQTSSAPSGAAGNSQLSVGGAVGIGIAATIIAFAIGIGLFLCLRRRRQPQYSESIGQRTAFRPFYNEEPKELYTEAVELAGHSYGRHELK